MFVYDLLPDDLRPLAFSLHNALARLKAGQPEGSKEQVADELCLLPEPLWDEVLAGLSSDLSDELQRMARRRVPVADLERFKSLLAALGLDFEETQQVRKSSLSGLTDAWVEWLVTLKPEGARELLCFHADGRYAGRKPTSGEIALPEGGDPEDLAWREIRREVQLALGLSRLPGVG